VNRIKYYAIRWLVYILATVDHLIGVCTLGFWHTSMGMAISIRYLLYQLNSNDHKYTLKEPHTPYEPGWFYNVEGNQIEAYWSNKAFYAKWINPDLTVYKNRDGDIVGVCVCGVKQRVINEVKDR